MKNPAGSKHRTGPKTDRGKRHSSRNALRHGLSTPIEYDPNYSTLIEPLSRAILGEDRNSVHLPHAGKVAKVLLEIDRLRRHSEPDDHQVTNADRQLLGDSTRSKATAVPPSRYLSRAYGHLRLSIKHLDDAQWRSHAPPHRRPNGVAPIEIDFNTQISEYDQWM